eukprot:TRINITY_DN2339_c0_g1_i1.p1 TRINITY_DN2339_c0_g1~~TRINITY_DN2339_c0_g1_i1.p1  ORF type:complete len:130 (-),score=40.20 TRINITY_DN2339_c0_g1_i1:34-423(-)
MAQAGRAGAAAVAAIKTSTGLVGLAVEPNAPIILTKLYHRILRDLKAVPEDTLFRWHKERTINFRLRVMNEEKDIKSMEARINSGNLEELIVMAREELSRMPSYIENQYWKHDPNDPTILTWTWEHNMW